MWSKKKSLNLTRHPRLEPLGAVFTLAEINSDANATKIRFCSQAHFT